MKNPEIAVRTEPFQESVIREMTRLGNETKAVNLSQGLPDFNPPTEILEAAITAIKKGENQYTFPFGSFLFREALADKYAQYNHIHADPEKEITITCGVSKAIMDAVMGLTDPGDEVIILEPWYENYTPTGKDKGIYKVRINFAKKESTLKKAAKRLRKLQRFEK